MLRLFRALLILSMRVSDLALFKPCELLGHPYSTICYNVAGNGKREGLKSYGDWAISSQATRKLVEGSESNANYPNVKSRVMRRHERMATLLKS